jgi:galactan endo-1,6-beta-galactosidase
MRKLHLAAMTIVALFPTPHFVQNLDQLPDAESSAYVRLDTSHDLGIWEGWGSSLAWWARAVGGSLNADYYADLVYTSNERDGFPGLGLNIVRYNVGGGGIHQPRENKGAKLEWQMDIHGYWTDSNHSDSKTWTWSTDQNQRTMMRKARDRGANLFEMFSDSPMWWMNANRSTAGSNTGGDCLTADNYDRFALYLAAVARHAADHWQIKFNSVEPFNEPSANWWKYPNRQEGCHFDAPTQGAVLERMRRALDEAGLKDVAIAAADENNMDAGLNTWHAYDSATRFRVGRLNVHGYANGTEPYRGPKRAELRRAVRDKARWLSEYGDGDASGYSLAQEIIRDVKELQPTAWVYWQPVEPDVGDFGWGLINANYVDTKDQPSQQKTELVRVNRKFFVFGQFTRYLRPGYHLIEVADPDSIAAFDPRSSRLVVIKVTGNSAAPIKLDLSNLTSVRDTIHMIATTTDPSATVPDWKQHNQGLQLAKRDGRKLLEANLYPKSVYTFVVQGVLR